MIINKNKIKLNKNKTFINKITPQAKKNTPLINQILTLFPIHKEVKIKAFQKKIIH